MGSTSVALVSAWTSDNHLLETRVAKGATLNLLTQLNANSGEFESILLSNNPQLILPSYILQVQGLFTDSDFLKQQSANYPNISGENVLVIPVSLFNVV